MEDDIRRRSACDRCHSQKLRCPKREGAVACDRCVRAGASCLYSPFRQKKDPEKSQHCEESPVAFNEHTLDANVVENREGRKSGRCSNANKRKRISLLSPETDPGPGSCNDSVPTSQAHISEVTEADWSTSLPAFHDLMNDSTFGDMNFEDQAEYPPLEFDLPSIPNFRDADDKMNNFPQFRSPPLTIGRSLDGAQFGRPFSPLPHPLLSPSNLSIALHTPQLPVWAGDVRKPQQSVFQCIRQLLELSLSLYEHSMRIPPESIHDPPPEGQLYGDVMNKRVQDYSSYKVDDTFRLTQELVDIYPSFVNLFTRRNISPSSNSSNNSASHDRARMHSPSGEPLGSIAPTLDHSSILLLISCHLRLIEIYGELFKHMKVCIDQRGAICTPQQGTFTAPTVRVGDYVLPATTSVPIQMMLLLHFATSLRDNAVELESQLRESQNGSTSSGSSANGSNGDGLVALSLASAEKVKDRAAGMLNHLSSLRLMMVRDGHIK